VLEVLPQLDAATRSVQARIPLDNPRGRLAAGMLADVVIEVAGDGRGLLVPLEALIRTGRSERVIVALGDGRFAPREVRAGAESGEDVEILGWIHIRNLIKDGRIFARHGVRAAGVAFDGGNGRVVTFRPRHWFDKEQGSPSTGDQSAPRDSR